MRKEEAKKKRREKIENNRDEKGNKKNGKFETRIRKQQS